MVYKRKVKYIINGDTFIISKKIGKTNTIKLAGINSHINNKSGAEKLRKLIEGKTVTIVPVEFPIK